MDGTATAHKEKPRARQYSQGHTSDPAMGILWSSEQGSWDSGSQPESASYSWVSWGQPVPLSPIVNRALDSDDPISSLIL